MDDQRLAGDADQDILDQDGTSGVISVAIFLPGQLLHNKAIKQAFKCGSFLLSALLLAHGMAEFSGEGAYVSPTVGQIVIQAPHIAADAAEWARQIPSV